MSSKLTLSIPAHLKISTAEYRKTEEFKAINREYQKQRKEDVKSYTALHKMKKAPKAYIQRALQLLFVDDFSDFDITDGIPTEVSEMVDKIIEIMKK